MTTKDIRNEFIRKYEEGDFRMIGNEVQQGKTIEIQNAHFLADQNWIIRQPSYKYFKRELEWYLSMSLNVNDIPGEAPSMWKACAAKDGSINSNYGWCILSQENFSDIHFLDNQLHIMSLKGGTVYVCKSKVGI